MKFIDVMVIIEEEVLKVVSDNMFCWMVGYICLLNK